MKEKNREFNHISLEDRINIQTGLNAKKNFTTISKEIGKSISSVSREIANNSTYVKTGAYGKKFNNCEHNYDCTIQGLCNDLNCNKTFCKYCEKCLNICNNFKEKKCKKLSKKSFTCNSCDSLRNCILEKRLYKASEANKSAQQLLKESRSGFNLTEEKVEQLNNIVAPAIQRGLSINAILSENKDSLMISETSLYNYTDAGIIKGISNLDLPLKVKYKPRKKISKELKIDKTCRIGRTFQDFKKFIQENPDLNIVEIDSVEGKKGGKVLMTMYFRTSNLMLGFLRDSNDSRSVIDIFKKLFKLLGKDLFKQMFFIILTDNGSEFSNPKALEFIDDEHPDEKIINVFYCDPSCPGQKGGIEHNHTLFRRVIPKYTSLDNLTQEKVDLIFNHVNSYTREKLSNNKPYTIFKTIYGEQATLKLGIKLIPFEELNLTPNLIKQ